MDTIDVWTPPGEGEGRSSGRRVIWKRAIRHLVQPGLSISHNESRSKQPAISAERRGSMISTRILKLCNTLIHGPKASSMHRDHPTSVDLPYDLLDVILRLVAHSSGPVSLAPCLVSKAWNAVATDILYESVSHNHIVPCSFSFEHFWDLVGWS